MRLFRSLAAATLAAGLSSAAGAQEMSPETRAEVLELLTYQCGAHEETEMRFRAAIGEYGRAPAPLLVEVLRDGIPADIREAAAARAAERYERRQRWLEENGTDIFGETAEAAPARSRDDYIADAVRRTEALYRENAVRGLGVVGGEEARAAIQSAVERDPGLEMLGNRALDEMP